MLICSPDRFEFVNPENNRHVLKQVEKVVVNTYSNLPELIRRKELDLSSEKHWLAHFLEFIAEERGNRTIGKALQESENKVQSLECEIDGVHRSCAKVFQSPPVAWMEERLSELHTLLE